MGIRTTPSGIHGIVRHQSSVTREKGWKPEHLKLIQFLGPRVGLNRGVEHELICGTLGISVAFPQAYQENPLDKAVDYKSPELMGRPNTCVGIQLDNAQSCKLIIEVFYVFKRKILNSKWGKNMLDL